MSEGNSPSLKKLDLTIARLRLLVAELHAREESNRAQRELFLRQRDKLMTFTMYGDARYEHASLASLITMLAEMDDRVSETERTARVLAVLHERVQRELESLQLTKGVEEARVQLAALLAAQAEGRAEREGEALSPEEREEEIGRLRLLINDASEQAARSIEASKWHG